MQALTNTYVSFLLCYVWLMFKFAYYTHSGELMRAKRTVTLWLYCAPSPRKNFCLSVSLTLENRVFRCSLFSKFFVSQNCAFCSFRSAFLQKFKSFWTLEASPPNRTADARSYGSRQNSQRYTLRFSGVQILFQVLVPGELEP